MGNVNTFGSYSQYYDLLYKDKDYDSEAQFLNGIIQKHAPGTNSLLELGCGTGLHAEKLSSLGYRIHGVDISEQMLEQADRRLLSLPQDRRKRLSFSQADIRNFTHPNDRFDAAISLFHVLSYQIQNIDLNNVFKTVKRNLKPEGLFVFDCWYGPAVLRDPPVVRIKRLGDEHVEITRIAEPVLFPTENRVDVNYQIYIKDRHGDSVRVLHETHPMRYLFTTEILNLCEQHGFVLKDSREWMSDKQPGFDTWGVYFVVQK